MMDEGHIGDTTRSGVGGDRDRCIYIGRDTDRDRGREMSGGRDREMDGDGERNREEDTHGKGRLSHGVYYVLTMTPRPGGRRSVPACRVCACIYAHIYVHKYTHI